MAKWNHNFYENLSTKDAFRQSPTRWNDPLLFTLTTQARDSLAVEMKNWTTNVSCVHSCSTQKLAWILYCQGALHRHL